MKGSRSEKLLDMGTGRIWAQVEHGHRNLKKGCDMDTGIPKGLNIGIKLRNEHGHSIPKG